MEGGRKKGRKQKKKQKKSAISEVEGKNLEGLKFKGKKGEKEI